MRLHPLSIPYRAVAGSANLGTLVFLGTLIGSGSLDPTGLSFLGLLVGYLVLMGGYQVVYYRRFEYVLADGSLDITSGVVSRRQREIPLGRVQNVDVSQNPVQRAIGIAAVRIETAGGGDTEAVLKYVGRDRARALQRELGGSGRDSRDRIPGGATDGTATGAGQETGTGETAGRPEETVIFELPTRNLALLSLFTIDPGAGAISSAVAALSSGGDPQNVFMLRGVIDRLPGGTLQAVVLVVAIVAVAAWLLSVVLTFARYYGFRLVRVGDELEYERGLLQRHSGTIPMEKVQTLSVHENVLKRRFGYATLAVETAGYGPSSGGGGSESAVPLAERDRVLSIAERIEGVEDPEIERPPRRARQRYAVRFGTAVAVLAGVAYAGATRVAFVPDPGTNYWLAVLGVLGLALVGAHLRWTNRGHATTDDHFVSRTGFWARTTRIVPYFRVQTVADTRTVFQRRRRLASVTADTASSRTIGGGGATAIDVDDGEADRLREVLRSRLRERLADRRIRRPGSRRRDPTGPGTVHGTGDRDTDPDVSRSSGADVGGSSTSDVDGTAGADVDGSSRSDVDGAAGADDRGTPWIDVPDDGEDDGRAEDGPERGDLEGDDPERGDPEDDDGSGR